MVCLPDQLGNYYSLVELSLNNAKAYRERQIESAKQFLFNELPTLVEDTDVLTTGDKNLQKCLFALCHHSEPDIRARAALCLRYYISHAARKGAELLAQKYLPYARQSEPQLNANEFKSRIYEFFLDDDGSLLQFILEDNHHDHNRLKFTVETVPLGYFDESGRHQQIKRLVVLDSEGERILKHKPFTFDILASYNPGHSNGQNLRNFTIQRILEVTPYSPLDHFLRKEYNIFIRTCYQLLNEVTPKKKKNPTEKLRRIETFFGQSDEQIKEDLVICEIYHNVRQDLRLQGVRLTSRDCLTPQSSLIQKTSAQLQPRNIVISPEALVERLKKIAKLILEYKTKDRGNTLSLNQALDNSGERNDTLSDHIPSNSRNDLDDLLRKYVQRAGQHIQENFFPLWENRCFPEDEDELDNNYLSNSPLAKSIREKMEQRKQHLQTHPNRNRSYGPQHYFPASRLFYCDQLSMTEIASRLGLKSQRQVSDLLELSKLIDGVQDHLVKDLWEWLNKCEEEEYQLLKADINYTLIKEHSSEFGKYLLEINENFTSLFENAKKEIRFSNKKRNSLIGKIIGQISCYKSTNFQGD